jgi:hypothetical protein
MDSLHITAIAGQLSQDSRRKTANLDSKKWGSYRKTETAGQTQKDDLKM